MRNIFRDKGLQKKIEDEGYVILPNYLTQTELTELTDFYNQIPLGEQAGFHMSNWSAELEERRKIYNKIVEVLTRKSEEYLERYKPILSCFAAKKPREDSEMDLHQDWSLVDETQFASVSIWVPLVDINQENGNIQVLRKSHLYATAPRGQNIPVPFESIKEVIKEKHMIGISMKAGDAMIFEHHLIHGSPKNKSDKPRVAAVLALIPEEATLVHYFMNPESDRKKIELLELENDLYVGYNFFNPTEKPPHKRKLKEIDFEVSPITNAHLL